MPVASVMAVRLRRATEADIEFLAKVVLLSVEDCYKHRGGWDRDAFHSGLLDDAADQIAGIPPDSMTYVITADGSTSAAPEPQNKSR